MFQSSMTAKHFTLTHDIFVNLDLCLVNTADLGEHDTSEKHSVVSKGKMKAVEINKDDIIDLLSDHEKDRKAAQQRRSFTNSKLVEAYAAKTLFWYCDAEVEEADDGNEHQEETNGEIDLWGGSEATAHIPLTDWQHKCLCSMDDDQ